MHNPSKPPEGDISKCPFFAALTGAMSAFAASTGAASPRSESAESAPAASGASSISPAPAAAASNDGVAEDPAASS